MGSFVGQHCLIGLLTIVARVGMRVKDDLEELFYKKSNNIGGPCYLWTRKQLKTTNNKGKINFQTNLCTNLWFWVFADSKFLWNVTPQKARETCIEKNCAYIITRQYCPSSEETRGQLRQHFYVRKLRIQLFCAYIIGLYFTGAKLSVQKLRVERW